MWSQPKQSVDYPKAVVEFIQSITAVIHDPSLLDPIVAAAKEIDQAQAVTQELLDRHAKAVEDIALGVNLGREIAVQRATLAKAHDNLIARGEDMARREKQHDARNNDIMIREQELAGKVSAIVERERLVTSRETQVRIEFQENAKVAGQLTRREDAVAAREKATRALAASLDEA